MEIFDKIELNIVDNNPLESWIKYHNCQILINGKDLLELTGLSKEFIYMKSQYLYDELMNFSFWNELEENRAIVLCCACGEIGCDSISTRVTETEKFVVWDKFKTLRGTDIDLSFKFKLQQYNEFIEDLKNAVIDTK